MGEAEVTPRENVVATPYRGTTSKPHSRQMTSWGKKARAPTKAVPTVDYEKIVIFDKIPVVPAEKADKLKTYLKTATKEVRGIAIGPLVVRHPTPRPCLLASLRVVSCCCPPYLPLAVDSSCCSVVGVGLTRRSGPWVSEPRGAMACGCCHR